MNSTSTAHRRPAILLVGPTGSGKTPMGNALAFQGLRGKRCAHFDFGQQLRDTVNGPTPATMTADDVAFLKDTLTRGALLENDTFFLAEKLIEAFLQGEAIDAEWIILNGLPRHTGQAADIAPLFDVREVWCLSCTPEVIASRIEKDTGGDRSGRSDDHLALVQKKIATFNARTAPLVAHYRAQGCRIAQFEVGENTSATDAIAALMG